MSSSPTSNDLLQVTCATAARPGKTLNEDLVGTTDGLFFVLDGSSVPPELPSCCDRDAAWYVRRLSAALVSALAGREDVTLAGGLAQAIEAVASEHHRTCPHAEPESLGPSAAVALVRQKPDSLDYLLLGDVSLIIETDTAVTHQSDRRLAAVASDVRDRIRRHLELGNGYDSPSYRTLLLELVNAERTVRNKPHGYWIASNEPSAAHHALVGSTPLRPPNSAGEVNSFALLSDGLARSVAVLQVHDSWADLMTDLRSHGPAVCIQAVRNAETADPAGQRHPRTALSDDATGLLAVAIASGSGPFRPSE